ncbi:MAG: hypothetical protein FIA92_06775 [Chloroflexi bacterium]|nr:hypothetical protein [Chloroflexota bacterium]
MNGRQGGIVALVIGCVLAAIGLIVYEAWWTIAFAIAGITAAVFAQPDHRALRYVVATIDSVVLILAGAAAAFVGVLSRQWGGPCVEDACRRPASDALTLGGFTLLAFGVVALVLTVTSLLRSRRA